MPLSDSQMDILKTLITALFGSGTTMGIQWLAKRKSPQEKADDNTRLISDSADSSVKAAQVVVDMLQKMLEEQREFYEYRMVQTEKEFNEKIAELNTIILELKSHNAAVESAFSDMELKYNVLKRKYEELKTRFSKYETELITGDHREAIQQVKEEFAKQKKDKQ